jgi:hypothetical protein
MAPILTSQANGRLVAHVIGPAVAAVGEVCALGQEPLMQWQVSKGMQFTPL